MRALLRDRRRLPRILLWALGLLIGLPVPSWRRFTLLGGAALLILTNTGCAGALQSQVLDAQTRQPLSGAVVLCVWTKVVGFPGLQHHDLVDVQETETDAQGHFSIGRPQSRGNEEAVTIYKFGYVAWSNLYTFPTSPLHDDTRVPATIALEAFPPGQSHQRHMSFINNATAAGMYGLERIPKFWGALRQELRMP